MRKRRLFRRSARIYSVAPAPHSSSSCLSTRRIKSETTMPTHGLMRVLAARLDEMAQGGRLKGRESVICGVVPGRDIYGPRYLIEGEGGTPFLRMNSNSYLGDRKSTRLNSSHLGIS